MREIILHCFQFKLKDIISILPKIKECGYTAIQITPIQECKENGTWWGYYQPLSFTIGNDIGTKEELKELSTKANELGIKVIVDVICNHVAGRDNGELKPYEKVDKILIDNSYFWRELKPILNWDDRKEVLTHCDGLPTLRLDNWDLQNIIIKFLNELVKDCNVNGFRFDSGKSIALPDEGSDFWTRVLNSLETKEKLFNYAEVIFADKNLIDRYCKYVNVVTNSFGSDNKKLVTYIENHDSFLGLGYTKKMTDEMIIREWDILLKNKEWNVMFYCRPYSDLWCSEEIKNINIKK